MTRARLVPGLLILAAIVYWWGGRPSGEATHLEIDWHREPIQTATDREPIEIPVRQGIATLTPRAAYDVAARVEGREEYRFDASAILSPVDLVLTWGDLPEPAWRDKLDYSQNWRAFAWRTTDSTLDTGYVIRHSANTHLIPANRNLKRALLTVDAGDDVRLTGYLVDSSAPGGFRWQTSLNRSDHGDRGCEVLYVESVQIGDRLYR